MEANTPSKRESLAMKALILAAGKGERLLPTTENCPKVLVPIIGKPIIEYIINDLAKLEIKQLVVVVGHKSEQVKEYLSDGAKFGVNISYVHQKILTGEAEAILAAEGPLQGTEPFLVVDGDFVADAGLIGGTMRVGLENDADIAVALTRVQDPTHFGVVKLLENNRILDVVEKPPLKEAPSNLAVSSIYLFKSSIFEPLKKIRHLEATMSHMMKSGSKAYGMIWESDWIDIGRPWDYLRANQFLMKRVFAADRTHIDSSATVASGAKLEEPYFIGPNAVVMDNASVKGSYVDEGARVGTNSLVRDFSYIGRRAVVGFACEIKSSVIMDETAIGHLAYVGDSVVGRRCEIGAGAITANTRFDKGTVKMRIDGKEVDSGRIGLGAIIGDDAQIGVNVSIYPGRRIGCGAWIRPGEVVDRDVASRGVV